MAAKSQRELQDEHFLVNKAVTSAVGCFSTGRERDFEERLVDGAEMMSRQIIRRKALVDEVGIGLNCLFDNSPHGGLTEALGERIDRQQLAFGFLAFFDIEPLCARMS